jgi:hypothetical protein
MSKKLSVFLMHVLSLSLLVFSCPVKAFSNELPEGVRPLQITQGKPVESFIPKGTVFLNDPKTVEGFLQQVEHHPPNWKYLYGSNVDERYDRLFEEMETRDAARVNNPALNQRVGFLWYGALTSFRSEVKGFGVAIGPHQIQTAWGIVRFKVAEQPFEMVTIPPDHLLEKFKSIRKKGGEIEVNILFMGRLIPEESLMYDFSSDQEGEGMILPIVELDQVEYLFNDREL